jgi:hypothetical protein
LFTLKLKYILNMLYFVNYFPGLRQKDSGITFSEVRPDTKWLYFSADIEEIKVVDIYTEEKNI